MGYLQVASVSWSKSSIIGTGSAKSTIGAGLAVDALVPFARAAPFVLFALFVLPVFAAGLRRAAVD